MINVIEEIHIVKLSIPAAFKRMFCGNAHDLISLRTKILAAKQ